MKTLAALREIIQKRILRNQLVESQYSSTIQAVALRRKKELYKASVSVLKSNSSNANKNKENKTEVKETQKGLSPADKLKLTTPYSILIKNDQGQWRVLEAIKEENKAAAKELESKSEKVTVITKEVAPNGKYSFVRDEVGFMRVRFMADSAMTNQRVISHQAQQVRYAGVMVFALDDEGEAVLTKWSNDSGSYRPPAFLKAFAGLPTELFVEYSADSTSSPRSPISENLVLWKSAQSTTKATLTPTSSPSSSPKALRLSLPTSIRAFVKGQEEIVEEEIKDENGSPFPIKDAGSTSSVTSTGTTSTEKVNILSQSATAMTTAVALDNKSSSVDGLNKGAQVSLATNPFALLNNITKRRPITPKNRYEQPEQSTTNDKAKTTTSSEIASPEIASPKIELH